LSVIIVDGIPLRAVNLLKLLMNPSDVKFGTKSKCSALTMQHVYKQIQTFGFSSLVFTYNGPRKSMPVAVKGGASFTRNSGSGGAGGAW
jgi:hypothetical protein